MNKITKGTIAAGAAVLLLLGTGGTLAYWNDSAALAGTSIQTGELTLAVAPGAAWDEDIDVWVPGDSDTFTATLVLTATGDHMKGVVAIDETSLTIPAGFSIDLAADFDELEGESDVFVDNLDGTITFEGNVGTVEIPILVTATFPYGASVDNTSQDQTVDLSSIAFQVTQQQP